MSAADLGSLRAGAAAAMAGGRAAEAETLLRRILALVPEDPRALGMLGIVQAQLGQLPEAEATLARVAASTPLDVAVRFNLGYVRRLQGEPRAAADFEAVVSINPGHLGAWMNLGDLFLEAGQAAAAGTAYARAAQLAPQIPEPLLGIGRAANALQSFADAEGACRRAIALAGGFALAWLELGRACLGLHRHEEAEAAFRGVLRLGGEDADAIAAAREHLAAMGVPVEDDRLPPAAH